MSIYKRGDKWGVDICFPDGRRIKKVVGNKKEAEAVETKLKQEIIEQKWQVRFLPKITFGEFLIQYLAYINQQHAKSTLRVSTNRIQIHLKPFFARHPLAMITRQKIDAYRFNRQKQGASANTIRNEFMILSHIFKMAIRWGFLFFNPVQGAEKPKVPKQPPRYLTESEAEKLLAHCQKHIYPIVLCALNTGLRKSELLNLRWSDVDLQNKQIVIRSSDNHHTKNYDYRFVGINEKLFAVLSTMPREGEYVFSYAGQPILDIKRSITSAYKQSGVNHYGQPLHILRHTFATNLIKQGVQLEKIQRLLGHRDFSTTLQYAHLTSRSVKDEVNKLT
jgi:integrase